VSDLTERPIERVDVVLPCLNEAAALPWVLSRLPAEFRPIVVDNGSTDGSAEVARQAGATVISVPERGFGAACHAGLVAAETDVVCVMDADASLDPGDLPQVAADVIAGTADLVLGRRVPTERRAWPWHARLANAVLAGLLRNRTGTRVHDLGPMRAMRRERVLDLEMTDRRFGYPLEMVIRAAVAGWRIREVPVPYRPRIGRSKVTGTLTGTTRAALDMARVAREAGRGAGDLGRQTAGSPTRGEELS
jgi:glycosyltransferase involved in cell wall biosynthesis